MVGYNVKVRKTPTFLFGGENVEYVIDSNLFLLCRVDDFGEEIHLATKNKNDTQPIGRIKPGETVLVPLANITGVVASTQTGDVDSDVRCTILCPPES